MRSHWAHFLAVFLFLGIAGHVETASTVADKDILLDLVARCSSRSPGDSTATATTGAATTSAAATVASPSAAASDSFPALALNWTSDRDLCTEWRGIACDPTRKHVMRISLPPTGGAPVPPIVCDAAKLAGLLWEDLTYLSFLRLQSQGFHGSLPAQVLRPPNLQYVSFRENNLTGLPSSRGLNHSLTRMTSVDFSENPGVGLAGGGVPHSLVGLSLQHLSLSGNFLVGTLPGDLFAAGLVSVDLSGNSLTGTIPESLWQESLRAVDLGGGNSLSGPIAAAAGLIGDGAAYVDIRLGSNALSGTIPTTFASLSKLDVLDLSNNALTGHVPEVGNIEAAVSVDLSGNDFDCPLPSPASVYRDNASASCTCREGLYGNDVSCRFCPVGTANGVFGSAAGGWVSSCDACPEGQVAPSIGSTACADDTPSTTTSTTTTTTHPADGAVEHYNWGIFAGGVWLVVILILSAASAGQEFGAGQRPEWGAAAARAMTTTDDDSPRRWLKGQAPPPSGATVVPLQSTDLTFGKLLSVEQQRGRGEDEHQDAQGQQRQQGQQELQ